ncbi:DUF6894 family protein [Sphingomonas endolithica]|uniref:DUF6894 family protein n=1 Tax=Sphingomonas endolithica TaxID=2972485 RepID=UPI0021AF418E|nr:hypothetical protein [Sphingomonas sp. ZFBP2030]
MSLFYLNLRTTTDFIGGEDGIELPSLAAAVATAAVSARDIMSEAVQDGDLQLGETIEIHDAQGRFLSAVHFCDVLKIRLGAREIVARA